MIRRRRILGHFRHGQMASLLALLVLVMQVLPRQAAAVQRVAEADEGVLAIEGPLEGPAGFATQVRATCPPPGTGETVHFFAQSDTPMGTFSPTIEDASGDFTVTVFLSTWAGNQSGNLPVGGSRTWTPSCRVLPEGELPSIDQLRAAPVTRTFAPVKLTANSVLDPITMQPQDLAPGDPVTFSAPGGCGPYDSWRTVRVSADAYWTLDDSTVKREAVALAYTSLTSAGLWDPVVGVIPASTAEASSVDIVVGGLCDGGDYTVQFQNEFDISIDSQCSNEPHWDGFVIVAPPDCSDVNANESGYATLDLSAGSDGGLTTISVEGSEVGCDSDSVPDPNVARMFCVVLAPPPGTETQVIVTFSDPMGSTVREYQVVPYVAPPVETIDAVVLGDSYSSGEGTYSYDIDQGCHTSSLAWGGFLDTISPELDVVANLACSGAEIEHLTDDDFKGHDPQLEQLEALVNGGQDVDMVLFTIGGNDANFKQAIGQCYYRNGPKNDCASSWLSSPKPIADSIKQRIEEEVLPELERIAPDADVVLVGYPRLFPRNHGDATNCGWLASNEREMFNAAVGALTVRGFWLAQDTDAYFVSSLNALEGHELCTEDSYFNPIYGRLLNPEQAHPTSPGYLAWATHIRESLIAQDLLEA